MTQITTLEQAKKLFGDAEQLNITLEAPQPVSGIMVRRVISPDYCVIHYDICEGHIKVITSMQAKDEGFPDDCEPYNLVKYGRGQFAKIGYVGKCIQVTLSESLHKDRALRRYVEKHFGQHLYRINFFDEVDMTLLTIKGMTYNEVKEQLNQYYPRQKELERNFKRVHGLL